MSALGQQGEGGKHGVSLSEVGDGEIYCGMMLIYSFLLPVRNDIAYVVLVTVDRKVSVTSVDTQTTSGVYLKWEIIYFVLYMHLFFFLECTIYKLVFMPIQFVVVCLVNVQQRSFAIDLWLTFIRDHNLPLLTSWKAALLAQTEHVIKLKHGLVIIQREFFIGIVFAIMFNMQYLSFISASNIFLLKKPPLFNGSESWLKGLLRVPISLQPL